jgi:prokaryotic ubiquitin-like protein Pup
MATRDTGGGQSRASRRSEETDEAPADVAPADEVRERAEKLDDDVESLLDEIDDVLEENAEEFVRGYVQKGGQ